MSKDEIYKILENSKIPDSLDISPFGIITNLPKFIMSHRSYIEANSGNKAYLPYYHRLALVAKRLKNEKH